MSEGDFWNNLDSFVEKQKQQTNIVDPTTNIVEKERVDDWVKNVNDATASKSSKTSVKIKSPR